MDALDVTSAQVVLCVNPKKRNTTFIYEGLLNKLADFIIYNLLPNIKLR